MDIKQFIEDNIKLIENSQWLRLYELLSRQEVDKVSELNTILLRIGVNPLDDLNYVPRLFLAWSDLTNIDIPDHIEVIKDYAFYKCKFRRLKLPELLERIGEQSFAECNNLKRVVIPENVSMIGKAAFFNCAKLEEVVIGSNVRYIQADAFNLCHKLRNVYYRGTEKEWNESINMSHDSFPRTEDDEYPTIHFNYQGN